MIGQDHRARARFVPPALPAPVVLVITVIFVVLTLVRGLSWLEAQPGTVSALRSSAGFGVRFWGALLLAGGLVFFAALATRLHLAVWAGHTLLICIYFGIAVTTAEACIRFGGGASALTVPIGGLVWHTVISRVMRPFPPHPAS